MDDCIFCKLRDGELPSHKVYEDEHVLAFMDIHPITDGHVVLISKTHKEQVWFLDDTDYQGLMIASQKIAQKIDKEIKPFRVGMIIEGYEVAHAHTKVFPMSTDTKQTLIDQVFSDPDHTALEAMAKRLRID